MERTTESGLFVAGKGARDAPINRRSIVDAYRAHEANSNPLDNLHVLDPSLLTRGADGTKSSIFSRYVQDFINDGGYGAQSYPYTETQLEVAFFSSVYLQSALVRIARLASRIKLVAERKEGGRWVRAPEDILINRIMERDGRQLLHDGWLNNAIYGATCIYKVKSRKAILERRQKDDDAMIYDYKRGMVAGFEILDKPYWDIDEDVYSFQLRGLHIQSSSQRIFQLEGATGYLKRDEFVYATAWNPRNRNRGRSIVSTAMSESVTTAAIAQWAAEYFTRGAMPMVLVSLENSDPDETPESDLKAVKRQFENNWSGLSSTLRSTFLNYKVNVEQVGIPAEDVMAPDLTRSAMEGIAAAVGIPADLIVAPQGGTQERHIEMIRQAWDDVVIPYGDYLVDALNEQIGLPHDIRLVMDLSEIWELESDRGKKSETEIAMFQAGVQTLNETRQRLDMEPTPDLGGWFYFNNQLISKKRLLQQDKLLDERLFDQVTRAWEANLITREKALQMLGFSAHPERDNLFRVEIDRDTQQLLSEGANFIDAPGELPPLPKQESGERDSFESNGDKALEVNSYDPDEDVLIEPGISMGEGEIGFDDDDIRSPYDMVTSPIEDKWEDLAAESEESNKGVITVNPEPNIDYSDGPLFASLWFAGDGSINYAQNEVRKHLQEKLGVAPEIFNTIRFTPEAEWHCTLVYSDAVNTDEFNRMQPFLIKRMDSFEVLSTGLEVFENSHEEGFKAVVLMLDDDNNLIAAHDKIMSVFNAANVRISDYSKPVNYKPHITLAYIPSSIECSMPSIPRIRINPLSLEVQRDNYISVHSIQVDANWRDKLESPAEPERNNKRAKARQANIDSEWQAWKKAARRNPKKAIAFELMHLDNNSIKARLVRAGLDDLHKRGQDENRLEIFKEIDSLYEPVKTSGRYFRSIRAVVRGLWLGVFQPYEFIDQFTTTITRAFRRAWAEGVRKAGMEPDELSETQQQKLEQRVSEEIAQIPGFMNAIIAGSKANKGKLTPHLERGGLWAVRYDAVVRYAQMIAMGDRKLKWTYDPKKEHCVDCRNLHNKVYRASVWEKMGIWPQSAELNCFGLHCGCSTAPTDDPISRGRRPRIRGPRKAIDQPFWMAEIDNHIRGHFQGYKNRD
jgi:2'-5' RNA ligase